MEVALAVKLAVPVTETLIDRTVLLVRSMPIALVLVVVIAEALVVDTPSSRSSSRRSKRTSASTSTSEITSATSSGRRTRKVQVESTLNVNPRPKQEYGVVTEI